MENRDKPYHCNVCGTDGLPPVSYYDERSIQKKLPRIVKCSTCGTEYRLRKNVLAWAQVRNSFVLWLAPNMAAVLLTFGLALLIMYPFYLITKLIGRFIKYPIYKKID